MSQYQSISNYFIRHTMNQASKFFQAGLATYLRVYSPAASGSDFSVAAQYGFQISASGQQVTNDIQILPWPQVTEVNMRDIGLNAVQLSFGAKQFMISHSWVIEQQKANGYIDAAGNPDYYRVFRDPKVQGLYYNDRLGKIVSVVPESLGTQPWMWTLIVNFPEQPSQG